MKSVCQCLRCIISRFVFRGLSVELSVCGGESYGRLIYCWWWVSRDEVRIGGMANGARVWAVLQQLEGEWCIVFNGS